MAERLQVIVAFDIGRADYIEMTCIARWFIWTNYFFLASGLVYAAEQQGNRMDTPVIRDMIDGNPSGSVIGYIWETSSSGPKFKTINLPALQYMQRTPYQVFIWKAGIFQHFKDVPPGQLIEFLEGGLNKFKILGIEPTLGICATERALPLNPTFTSPGHLDLTRTSITNNKSNSNCISLEKPPYKFKGMVSDGGLTCAFANDRYICDPPGLQFNFCADRNSWYCLPSGPNLANITDFDVRSGRVCAISNGKAWCQPDAPFANSIPAGTIGGGLRVNPKQFRIGAFPGPPAVIDQDTVLGGPIKPLDLHLKHPTQLVMDGVRACVIDEGAVKCWGQYNMSSEKVGAPRLSKATFIAARRDVTCAIDETGVHCWGPKWESIVGLPVPHISHPTEVALGGLLKIDHICALGDGRVVCWGDEKNGAIKVPTDLMDVEHIAAGNGYSCALSHEKIRCWGRPTTIGKPRRYFDGTRLISTLVWPYELQLVHENSLRLLEPKQAGKLSAERSDDRFIYQCQNVSSGNKPSHVLVGFNAKTGMEEHLFVGEINGIERILNITEPNRAVMQAAPNHFKGLRIYVAECLSGSDEEGVAKFAKKLICAGADCKLTNEIDKKRFAACASKNTLGTVCIDASPDEYTNGLSCYRYDQQSAKFIRCFKGEPTEVAEPGGE